MKLPCLLSLYALGLLGSAQAHTFEPRNRLPGIGLGRGIMPDSVLSKRTDQMVQTQTFAILREPGALPGARRITSEPLRHIFTAAAKKSGVPVSLLMAVAYLESWGEATAESPTGPKGIMQVTEAAAQDMGLQITREVRYRQVLEQHLVRRLKGKPVYRTDKLLVPYEVVTQDDRLDPEKAIPAAADYLARMAQQYGGLDWAVFAYHCGNGCIQEVRELAQKAGLPRKSLTVAQVFFLSSPARQRELYSALRKHMARDFSPTYYFRVRCAEQILLLYEKNPKLFAQLVNEYRGGVSPDKRVGHRLAVWLKPADFIYRSSEDLRREQGRRLIRVLEDADLFGFTLRREGPGSIGEFDPLNQELYLQAAPAAVGALLYLAFETRRLHQAMDLPGEAFRPLEVTALVHPREYHEKLATLPDARFEGLSHSTGQVFDISYANLPPGEREALQFVLDDMGWGGYLGFVEKSPESQTLHIGSAPSARGFFTQVLQDALNLMRPQPAVAAS